MKTTNTCTPDFKVKDQCSYKVWMEQQEDWREVEWKEKQLYNPCMLSPILCSDASPAKSTVRNLPQILHIHAIWMSRSHSDCSIVSFWIHRPERTTTPSGSILVSCVCVPKLRSCCAATTWASYEWVGILLDWRICASLPTFHPFWISSGRPALLSLLACILQPSGLSGHSVCSRALGINPPVLSISRPTCWGSVSHWLSEEERHCFWEPASGRGAMGQEQNQ